LGGLGKGYAIDLMKKILDGFDHLLIDAGGDIFAKGKALDGAAWRLAFEHPKDVSQAIGIVEVDNFAVACTSPLRRKWRNRHHIVNPKKLAPACDMLAVYTQGADGITADAYSTALFVMGYEQSKKTVVDLPVEAMLVGPDGSVWKSEGFRGELF
jgi:thiamine biosynthesis lipoprotein